MKNTLPWIIAALAYIGPPTWAYLAIERDTAAQKATHGYACGNATIGIFLITFLASGILSISALIGRAWATKWWLDKSLARRTTEIFVLVLPAVIAILLTLMLYFG